MGVGVVSGRLKRRGLDEKQKTQKNVFPTNLITN